jgi:hypothetical protein
MLTAFSLLMVAASLHFVNITPAFPQIAGRDREVAQLSEQIFRIDKWSVCRG